MENRRSKKALLLVLAAVCVVVALTLVACNATTIQKVKFKVTFDVDGVSYYEINTQGTEVLQMPNDPTKEGFIFDGWFWDKDTWTRPFTANSLLNEPLKEDMRIYAKWKSESDEDDEKEPQIHGTELSAKTLTVDGKSLYAKLPNATETFSFTDEIVVADGATYAVHTDMSCSGATELRSKIAELKSGDNVFYILVTNGKDTELYTATIRRRPIYSVRFNVDGGTYVPTQYVEEDDLAEEPTTTRKGYTFDKWNYDFSNPIVRNTTITASWIADKYKITYVLNGGTDCNNVTEYTIADGIINLNDGIGEKLFCGWYLDDTFETYIETINCNELKDYTLYALFDGTNGLKISQGEVIDYNGNSKDITFPLNYKGFNVTRIGESAFRGCSELTSITIPNSIVSIGAGAFLECSKLTNVNIPNGVKSIYSGTFKKCIALTSVIIPDSVTAIGSAAFYGCSSLTGITIPDSVTKIGVQAFGECSGLMSAIIGNGVTSIGIQAFIGCSGLTSVTIGDSVTSIGSEAFAGCSELTSITIPESVTDIGYSAFMKCSGLTTVNWNAIACIIEDNYYSKYYPIFNGCTSLNTLNIGDSVTIIPNYAFKVCNELTHVTIGKSVKSIEEQSFYGCSGLTSVTIPYGVISIGKSAFEECSGLMSVTIPDSVTSIDYSAFNKCTGLSAVYIQDLAKWCELSFSGFFSNPLYYAHNLYLNGKLVADLVIPDSVTSIGAYAFNKCSGLTSVTIGGSVISIGNYAFEDCRRLTSVTMGNSVISIGDYAFEDCSGLTSVTMSNGVTSIGKYAFMGCRGLSAVYIQDIAKWCEISFANSDANPLCFAKNLYLNGELVTDLVVPDSVTRINDYAFRLCSGLTSVTIGNNVTNIGDWAFSSCNKVTSVIISNSVTSIGEYAFNIYNSQMCVYYEGTADDWANIYIYSDNDKLTSSPRYYYSEEEPPLNDDGTDYEGNYWHYVDGVVAVWVKEN